MAYSSSRGSSSRGRSGGGGGGGQNMMAYAVAGILVLLVIVVFFVMSPSKKKPAPAPAPTQAPTIPPPVVAPPKAPEKPWPVVPDSKVEEGRKLASSFDAQGAKANALYKEANDARKAGDTEKWQSKLDEMLTILEGIKETWNDFINSMPSNRDHDTEEVTTHVLGPESGRVQKLIKLLAAAKTDKRR